MPSDPNIQAVQNIPIWGRFIFDAFKGIQKQLQNLSTQTNASLTSAQTDAPPQVNAVNVTASGGIAHVQITDHNTSIYRGLTYHVDVASDAGFSAPCTFHMGPSRDIRIPVGPEPLFYRVFSDYPTSPPSVPVYHGGPAPVPVTASGTLPPPIPPGQGSGTGTPGQISGFGSVPFRGIAPGKRA